jgi:uncharacterized membrane protein YdbT with pleckstrin-like domain
MISNDFLTKDESVQMQLRPDFTATFLPIAFMVLFIVVLNGFWLLNPKPGIMQKFSLIFLSLSTIGLILVVGMAYLRYIYTFYIVTNRRIIYQSGVVARDYRDARLDRIQDISVGVNFLDRILDVGDIGFSTAGSPFVELIFSKVKNPARVKKSINEVIDSSASSSNLKPHGV